MAKRFYVCPVIGTGTITDPYRASLRDLLTESKAAMSVVIPSKPDGSPLFPWALVIIDALNHTPFQNAANTDSYPDITLDSTLSVLQPNQRNVLLNYLSKRGVDTTGLGTNSTFRDVINRIGKFLDVNFSSLTFDCRGG